MLVAGLFFPMYASEGSSPRVSAECMGLVPTFCLSQTWSLISCSREARPWGAPPPALWTWAVSCGFESRLLLILGGSHHLPPSLAVHLKNICCIWHDISRCFVGNGFAGHLAENKLELEVLELFLLYCANSASFYHFFLGAFIFLSWAERVVECRGVRVSARLQTDGFPDSWESVPWPEKRWVGFLTEMPLRLPVAEPGSQYERPRALRFIGYLFKQELI